MTQISIQDSREKGWTADRWSALFQSKGPWIVDGAMGTELLFKGWKGQTHWANRANPGLVSEIHEGWARVGARIHRTNTFLCTADLVIEASPSSPEPWDLIEEGVELALNTVGKTGITLAAFGPVDPKIDPPTAPPQNGVVRAIKRTDGILLETWSHPNVVLWARWLTNATRLPLIISWTFRKGEKGVLKTLGGFSVECAVKLAREAGAIATGANCGLNLDPEDFRRLVVEFERQWIGPLWFCPAFENGVNPLFCRDDLPGLDRMMVGGCCGSKPEDGGFWKKA